jgi:UDP-GlcNAc:undecaprenyl-phosphate/decaprenyl-phosphate GlcNAc-1-phosphate transferase
MQLGAWSYALAFVVSLVISLALTPLALRVATKRNVLDHPGHYKVQPSAVPYLGGAALAISFSITVLLATLMNPPPGGVSQLALILGLAVVLSFVGLADDLRTISPLIRFVVQLAAGVAVWLSGVSITLFDNAWANAVLTLVWIVGITNAFNLLDNMDGLSAGIAAISAAFFFTLAAINGQVAVAALSIALCGCALGFLRSNFHPARIYMGDAGSLFLGFLLAVIGIKLRFEAPQEITFMVPVLVLGVAIIDTTMVTISRLLHRRSPFAGGRDHISHRLVFVGLSVPTAVTLVYAAGISLGWLAIVMSRVDRVSGFILMGLTVTIATFMATLLGRVPVYSTSKRRWLMIQEVARHEEPEGLGEGADHRERAV